MSDEERILLSDEGVRLDRSSRGLCALDATQHDNGMYTIMDIGAVRRRLSAARLARFAKLQRLNLGIRAASGDRDTIETLRYVLRLAKATDLTSFEHEACNIAKKAVSVAKRGRPYLQPWERLAIAVASLARAAGRNPIDLARTALELIDVRMPVSKKHSVDRAKRIAWLGMRFLNEAGIKTDSARRTLNEVSRIGSAVGASPRAVFLASAIAREMMERAPRSPRIAAATSIYLAMKILGNESATMARVAEAAGCSEASLRHAIRAVSKRMDIDIHVS